MEWCIGREEAVRVSDRDLAEVQVSPAMGSSGDGELRVPGKDKVSRHEVGEVRVSIPQMQSQALGAASLLPCPAGSQTTGCA